MLRAVSNLSSQKTFPMPPAVLHRTSVACAPAIARLALQLVKALCSACTQTAGMSTSRKLYQCIVSVHQSKTLNRILTALSLQQSRQQHRLLQPSQRLRQAATIILLPPLPLLLKVHLHLRQQISRVSASVLLSSQLQLHRHYFILLPCLSKVPNQRFRQLVA